MPGEILVPERLLARPALFEVFGDWKAALTPLANPRFDSDAARRRLEALLRRQGARRLWRFRRAEIAAAGALVDYVALTQPAPASAPHLGRRARVAAGLGDADRRRRPGAIWNSPRTLSGERRGSLLATIDRTLTGPGARLLAEHLAAPLTAPEAIAARLDAVQFFVDRAEARAACASGCGVSPISSGR